MDFCTQYTNRRNEIFEIIAADKVLGIGPLEQLHEIKFRILKDRQLYFNASIQATYEFLRFLLRSDENKQKSDYEILFPLGLLKIQITLEEGKGENFAYIFNTENGPLSYELWHQQLINEHKWSKALLIKDLKNKYIVIDGIRYYIPDPITRNALGYRENQFIPKTEKEINEYKSGENIEAISKARLVRDKNNSDPIYLICKVPMYEKKYVPSQAILIAIGQGQEKVETITFEEINNIPEGKPLDEVRYWDIKQEKKNIIQPKKKWWQNEVWQIIGIISAVLGIIGFIFLISGLL